MALNNHTQTNLELPPVGVSVHVPTRRDVCVESRYDFLALRIDGASQHMTPRAKMIGRG